mmetsp:Transcript_38766/g.116508  ORF Transcript_38766/g.116508 Transcript_38766/m.116508 type:complete len:209 (-) Transcript_38766:1607-2233(-)
MKAPMMPCQQKMPRRTHSHLGLGGESRDSGILGGPGHGGVGSPGRHHIRFLESLFFGREQLGGLDPSCLLHANHLVSDNLAPVGTILVGLNDRDGAGLLIDEKYRLLPRLHALALGPLHAVLLGLNEALLQAGINDGNLLANELIGPDDETEGCQCGRIVLDHVPVEHANDPAARHVPPRLGLHGHVVEDQRAVLGECIANVSLVRGV